MSRMTDVLAVALPAALVVAVAVVMAVMVRRRRRGTSPTWGAGVWVGPAPASNGRRPMADQPAQPPPSRWRGTPPAQAVAARVAPLANGWTDPGAPYRQLVQPHDACPTWWTVAPLAGDTSSVTAGRRPGGPESVRTSPSTR